MTDKSKINKLYDEARLIDESNTPKAIDLYKSILALDSGFIPAWINLGFCYYTSKRFAESAYCYTRVLLIDPKRVEALYNLGCLAMCDNQTLIAKDWYTMTISIDPAYADAYYNRAKCNSELGLIAEAKRDYMIFYLLEPDSKFSQKALERSV